MFNNHQVSQLEQAAGLFKIAVPKSIIDATALHEAAVAYHLGIQSEREPQIDSIDIKNLKTVHERLVAWPSHSERERFSLKIEQNTESKRMWAWETQCHLWSEEFRQPFDDAAAMFIKCLTELGGLRGAESAELAIKNYQHESHRLLMSSAADLQTLANLRNVLDGPVKFDAGHVGISVLGRVLTLPPLGAFESLKSRLSREAPYEIKWWAIAATFKDVAIKWHTPSEQQTLATLRQG